MTEPKQYTDDLRKVRSLLIVTSLQRRRDLKARRIIEEFSQPLVWEPLADKMIDSGVWKYVVEERKYDPKLVFCHPELLLHNPTVSLYYRGLCCLSLKAANDYVKGVKSIEENGRSLTPKKALQIACIYNTFICSIINNTTEWTLENGYRNIIATMGITLDGVMRNKIGDIAEDRIRTLVLEWLVEHKLITDPRVTQSQFSEKPPKECLLVNDVIMCFGSEPDIAFSRTGDFLAIVEIKGGIDPAGALERYGAATKSFLHATRMSPRCRNFYLAAAFTTELERRIGDDRLVERTFDVIEILEDENVREQFFLELFHHTLRII
ncbi:MAG: XcyI family restriction endonuclease [Armatimonadetes bacterium]|nr:XcyI family restriction endonuclease [Armatimonadota bacterium]